MKRYATTLTLLFIICAVGLGTAIRVLAQDTDLVASLERLSGTVEVMRVGTSQWVQIGTETLIGVGDSVRTRLGGQALITFFANGTDTTVLPNSEFRIDTFTGSEDKYQLAVTVVSGQTTQRIAKLLDSGSSYTINSTGLELAVRGTQFAVRVEPSGRSATVVTEGRVKTKNAGVSSTPADGLAVDAEVAVGFGVRAESGKGLSEVVPATNFAELDAALDGCPATVTEKNDVLINLRVGPDRKFDRVGLLNNKTALTVIGATKSTKWYRTPFDGGYAWFYAPDLTIICPLLRRFPDTFSGEDVSRYKNSGSTIIGTTQAPTVESVTATATP